MSAKFKWIVTKTYCIAHGALLNVMCQLVCEEDLGGMHACICMAESLCCLPETVTRLLIGYTPIQNVFGVKK